MRATAAILGCLLLAGCASGAADVPRAASALPADASPPERLADALRMADAAARTGDEARLAAALAEIEALGGRPEGPGEQLQLAAWQERSGSTPIPMRGRTLGRGYRSGTITPGSDTVIEQTFLSGQKASIALSAADGAVLALSVLDGADQQVCLQRARRTACSWVPLFTQRHTIRVSNPGPGDARYYLVVD
jgi:hypothetical protein